MKPENLLLAAALLLAAGCSMEEFTRFGYEEAQRRDCMQAANNKPNESMEEFRCMTEPERGSYEEYQRNREAEFGKPPAETTAQQEP